jgi:predicted adenine nucleotide alpha hydrolase (AANH) superfamily ATPase
MDRNGYNPTILQDKEECFVSRETVDLVRHEVFYGTANRKLSKEYGLYRQDWCGCEFSLKEHEEKINNQ